MKICQNVQLSYVCTLQKSRERCSNGYFSTSKVGSLVVYFIIIKSTCVIKHHYRYNGSPIFTTDRKRDEEKYISVKSMNLVIKKRLFEHILSIKTVEIAVKNGSYAPLFLLLNIARGSVLTFTGNILGNFS